LHLTTSRNVGCRRLRRCDAELLGLPLSSKSDLGDRRTLRSTIPTSTRFSSWRTRDAQITRGPGAFAVSRTQGLPSASGPRRKPIAAHVERAAGRTRYGLGKARPGRSARRPYEALARTRARRSARSKPPGSAPRLHPAHRLGAASNGSPLATRAGSTRRTTAARKRGYEAALSGVLQPLLSGA
jgi:hypothetical protein